MTKEIIVGKPQVKPNVTNGNSKSSFVTKSNNKESLVTKMLHIVVSDITNLWRKSKENKEAYDRFVELAQGKK